MDCRRNGLYNRLLHSFYHLPLAGTTGSAQDNLATAATFLSELVEYRVASLLGFDSSGVYTGSFPSFASTEFLQEYCSCEEIVSTFLLYVLAGCGLVLPKGQL